ncbi:hypothetical protein LXL04_022106 [Taraxacum kok-saghyz]
MIERRSEAGKGRWMWLSTELLLPSPSSLQTRTLLTSRSLLGNPDVAFSKPTNNKDERCEENGVERVVSRLSQGSPFAAHFTLVSRRRLLSLELNGVRWWPEEMTVRVKEEENGGGFRVGGGRKLSGGWRS